MAIPDAELGQIEHPDPVIIPPKSGKHEQSFIVLHGRGSNGQDFGPSLLDWPISGFENVRTAFPNAKFVFPTAALRRAKIYKRIQIHQWFDNWSLRDPTQREELQYEGLKESTEYVHSLLTHEISNVGANNVILWGLSQGWAASMVALLLWEGEAFSAAIGMCGWLPLEKRMRKAISLDNDEDEGNPFAENVEPSTGKIDSGDGQSSKISSIVEYLRDVLQMPSGTSTTPVLPALEVPVFVGHGTRDDKVDLSLGRDAVELLREVSIEVVHKEYDGLHHWYSSDMLLDIIKFISNKAKWPIKTASDSRPSAHPT